MMAFVRLLLTSKACWIMVIAVMACAGMWRAGYVRGQSVVQSAWDSEQARTAVGIAQKAQEQDDRSHVAAVSYEKSASNGPLRTVTLCAWLSVWLIAALMLTACASGIPPMVAVPSLKTAGQSDDEMQDVADGDRGDVAGSGSKSH